MIPHEIKVSTNLLSYPIKIGAAFLSSPSCELLEVSNSFCSKFMLVSIVAIRAIMV